MLFLTLDEKVSEGNVYNIFYKMPIKYIDERTEVAQQGFNFFFLMIILIMAKKLNRNY